MSSFFLYNIRSQKIREKERSFLLYGALNLGREKGPHSGLVEKAALMWIWALSFASIAS